MKTDGSTEDKTGASREGSSSSVASNPRVIQAPSTCPFSGVPIDAEMWESFQAKLASNNHHSSNQVPPKEKQEDYLEMVRQAEEGSEGSRSPSPPRSFLRRSITTNYRVRVINETTKRSKDMVVDQYGGDNLYNAVYNHPTLKDAHIRKWGAEIAKQVKNGQSEIKVKVMVGDGSKFCRWFSVDKLKKTTTRQLYQMVAKHQRPGDATVICLVCVPSNEEKANTESVASSLISDLSDGSNSQSLTLASRGSNFPLAKTASPISNLQVRVINEATRRTKDMLMDCNKHVSLFDAIYNHPSVKAAHVRKWGSENVKMVKSGQSEIKVKVTLGNYSFCRWFSVEEMKETTTLKFSEMIEEYKDHDSIEFCLCCVPKSTEGEIIQEAEQRQAKKLASPVKKGVQFVDMESTSQSKQAQYIESASVQSLVGKESPASIPSNFRVCVVNQVSKRKKDLVVACDTQAFLFEAIYDHSSVKEAHVREWGSEVVKKIKSGQSDIKVKVSLGDNAFCRWFSVEELKKTTTLQFYEMIEEYQDHDSIVFCLAPVSRDSEEGGAAPRKSEIECTEVSAGDETEHERLSGVSASARNGELAETQANRPSHSLRKTQSIDLLSLGRCSSASERHEPPASPSMNGSSYLNDGSVNVGSVNFLPTSVAPSSYLSTMSDALESMSMMDAQSQLKFLAPMQAQAKSTLGVRVINQTSQRHKDVVVIMSDEDTVYDTVYNHPGVRSAHVRKWGGAIAKEVKNGTKEIKFSVWDDNTERPWKVFSIDELKSTTTRQLYDLVSESSNLIKIYLQCVDLCNDTTNSRTANPTDDKCANQSSGERKVMHVKHVGPKRQASLRLGKTGRPQHMITPRRQASLRLQKHGRPQFSIEPTESPKLETERFLGVKKTSRPNHMNWAATHIPRNGSCPTMQQLAALNGGAMARRVGSHDRLTGNIHQIGAMQRQAESCNHLETLSTGAMERRRPGKNGLLPREAKNTAVTPRSASHGYLNDLVEESSKAKEPVKLTIEPPQRELSHEGQLVGSKNEASKNASWQSRKTTGQQVPNRLLSGLKLSAEDPLRIQAATREFPAPDSSSHVVVSKTPFSVPTQSGADSLRTPSRSSQLDDFEANKPIQPSLGQGKVKSISLDESQQSASEQSDLRKARRRKPRRATLFRVPSVDDAPTSGLCFIQPKAPLKRVDSDPLSLGKHIQAQQATEEACRKLKEFTRLLRAKKLPQFQSQRRLGNKSTRSGGDQEIDESAQAVIETSTTNEPSLPSSSAATLQEQQSRDSHSPAPTNATENSSTPADKINRFLRLNPPKPKGKTKTNDKISRFLAIQKAASPEESPSKRISWCEPDDNLTGQSKSSQLATGKSISGTSGSSSLSRHADLPPLTEISVIANGASVPEAPTSTPGVSLSPELVKEIFPYHVVLDTNFHIVQVGNSLEMLIQESDLVGRLVSELMTVTSPMPMFGRWDWPTLEKMKDKTIFLESVLSPVLEEKVKLKGTLIDVSSSKSEKQVMLALFPNVKNLAELDEANLSMADLPLHSCQREAVLLGEHSKSEVNLTNHLDKLHRDLIDSMEQQIKDRTEELAAANRNLETANARLAIQSARQLEHFACMSHEIRTPLNCIVGMSSLLLDDAEEMDPMHADSIKMINTSGDLLKAVVDDVLDYAKLESGSFEVDIKDRNLQHTLNSVAHSISQKVQDKNIRLRLDFSPFLPKLVETDNRRLQQVLFNLLGNAGKFSKKNSVIDLTVSVVPVASTDVDPDDTSNGEVIRFAVKDYGKGIEEKDFKSIFEPFSQASKETQNVYGGTGLGLSITTKLVHRLGGTISLSSEYGKYAEFTVDLPLRGPALNVPDLREKMRNTSIVLVDTPKTYDYSFTDYEIKPEPTPFQTAVAEAFGLDIIRCEGLDHAIERIEKAKSVAPTRHFACLVNEDLYQTGVFEKLDTVLGRLNYTFMTFGPQYSVSLTKDRHFKNLSGVFPSALLESIAEHMERRRREKISNSGKPTIETAPSASSPAPAPAMGLFAGINAASPKPPSGGLFGVTSSGPSQPSGGLFGSIQNAPTGGSNGQSTTSGGLFSIAATTAPPPSTGQASASALPQPSSAPKAAAKQKIHSAARQALKVLYAEDNKVNQKVLSRVLTRSGITNVTIVDNGKKAVDITETEKFDIIFMDIQMPVMGGMEATKLITERNPSEKVVFCTAHALDEFKAQADAVGGTSFISKPFRLDDIEKLMDELGY